jgi:hypothetical protein
VPRKKNRRNGGNPANFFSACRGLPATVATFISSPLSMQSALSTHVHRTAAGPLTTSRHPPVIMSQCKPATMSSHRLRNILHRTSTFKATVMWTWTVKRTVNYTPAAFRSRTYFVDKCTVAACSFSACYDYHSYNCTVTALQDR